MSTDYGFIVNDLLDWYDKNARELPWRNQSNPYFTWVSEIMLQQTRVEAVKGYFARFVKAFPTIKDLATADPDQLLKLWEGLGYYNRVRNMQKAAITVVEQYNGELPRDYHALLKLSGIGTYTAGAIASIAYQIPVPAVDGNVLRVIKRLTGSYDDITLPKVKKELEEDMLKIMPAKHSGDLNQALMDLGATICIPNGKPNCEQCPLNKKCKAFQKNLTDEIPVKSSKKKRTIEEKTIFLLECNGKYALHKRFDKGLLAGLWEFPNMNEALSIEKLESILSEHGIHEYELELLGPGKHIFSHVQWHMIGYRIHLPKHDFEWMEDLVWVTKDTIAKEYAIPTAFKAYTSQL
ncbi:A/G-specific adenine glycosylase [[Clostridium] polysaccharolyticum]|uniref:Adenine DNA glycosylase n=1 Tax=[Clostridium] polysaccharolyticum TaxID=29364 RepID=A0A1I0D0L7_9FIRM|nr:A/G-specific adenine glycosylase [[Clostridium] polysaccharolyticum]SET25712.1 A/G-specific DNA-adenine glycosylase [[Clostridium] polysaccharolyticum]